LVHVSTDFVFDGSISRPYLEEDTTNPQGIYAQSKREGEEAVLDCCEHALVARTAWLYGGTGPDFIQKVLERARSGQPLRIVEDQIGSPTWVEDLATALAGLLDLHSFPRGILHVTNSGHCSRLELARAALELARIEAEVEALRTSDLPPGAPRPAWSVLDGTRYENLTGSAMRGWREALSLYLRSVESR